MGEITRLLVNSPKKEGKKMAKVKLGSGARFKALAKKVGSKKLAAYIGRKKYGAKKMAKMAAAGRKKG
jgi:hypothetical protein